MSQHRAAYDTGVSQTTQQSERPKFSAGPVVLFIAAVLVAGMTCVLYLWQQSRIVAGQQDILYLNAQLTTVTQQRDDLLAQEENLRSVTNVVAHALQYGMTQSDSSHNKYLAVVQPPTSPLVAQNTTPRPEAVILPATNAAVTSWWQGAWDSLYNLIQ